METLDSLPRPLPRVESSEEMPRSLLRMLRGEPAIRKRRFTNRFRRIALSADDAVIYNEG